MTQEEFEQIAPSLRDVMYSIGMSFFGNESDADEVAQEGLVDLWRYRDRMVADKDHKSLAVRIAKHCCINLTRKRRCTFVPIDNSGREFISEAADTAYSPQEILEANELCDAVDRALGNLQNSERRLYELRQIEGLSLDEISKETQISKTSVKSIISAARKKIFNELKKHIDNDI